MSDGRRDARGRERGAARASHQGRRSGQRPAERARSGDPAREVAFDVLREVAAGDAYANLVLPPLLRRRGIRGRDAAFATELTYGTLRLRGRYDAVLAIAADRPVAELDPPLLDVLRLGAHQVLGMRVPAHAAVSETVALARSRVGAGPAQLVNAVLRRVADTPAEDWWVRLGETGDEVERLAVLHSHPAWVVRGLRQALLADSRPAEDLPALLEADNAAPVVTLVVRPGLADRDAVLAALPGAEPGRWAPTAIRLAGGDPRDAPGMRDGYVAVQDEGSQLVTLALARVPLEGGLGDTEWLDLCAGPGGKSGLLGALAAQRGATLVANEVQPHRADLVRATVRALPNVEVHVGDGRGLGAAEPGRFARVLVDAPCTGLGALRRRPESRWRRTPSDLGFLGGLQRELLASALDAVAPGGVVGYVTCSPHVAETRLVVEDVVKRRDDVTLLDATEALRAVAGGLDLGPGPHAQLWPHVHGTDAMHLTLLRRA
ncbi:RsmB/NOP family class I SAM-dependent RNA methyltransferase [Actinotalea sp. M2MS4P-6]|uniref:RsmB/NOP family class I SAM-dependent RNA methyltransferase n=1 Tax=Actinotalea sp. M2MS4P-6 TaxID=2983762 RepID=UPI0021E44548|nr:RsmB/NOP family class I SAM-dependent RNA methyltransferase [Actinotalea sp. M2MS4P-6]MCV2394604.1 RsmB/NOP family class I SAM-dependent RNA methyltransferase [Actinotalea sp. M2MS4P-6]